ncbi:unnamed protein product [Prorocentrum cordatum]|uniref:Uncharacterized protein n=1 Tax=Prorocentrum cordatum TaxID=2364126 RepID=A0ABN9TDG4_9DINO|nr:unnamed protein product [Polarella glacialis]
MPGVLYPILHRASTEHIHRRWRRHEMPVLHFGGGRTGEGGERHQAWSCTQAAPHEVAWAGPNRPPVWSEAPTTASSLWWDSAAVSASPRRGRPITCAREPTPSGESEEREGCQPDRRLGIPNMTELGAS